MKFRFECVQEVFLSMMGFFFACLIFLMHSEMFLSTR